MGNEYKQTNKQKTGHPTVLSWVKSRIGILGSEATDKLSGECSGAGRGSLVMTPEGIKAQINGRSHRHKITGRNHPLCFFQYSAILLFIDARSLG